MRYDISISAFLSAILFFYGAGESGFLQAVLILAGGILGARAFHEEFKIRNNQRE